MTIKIIAALIAAVIILPLPGLASTFTRLNPYEPYNAVAAEPSTPYNLDLIPRNCRVAYGPCPSCVHASMLLPELPPVAPPRIGVFGYSAPLVQSRRLQRIWR
jgi:hypothetical protein